jgi:hypothetical protein
MTQTLALRIAAWAYAVLGVLFALLLVAGPTATGRVLSNGQVVSLIIFAVVSITLGAWAWRIQRGLARLSIAFFGLCFGAGPVVGVAFGGIAFALILGIPFLFVAIAWRKQKAALPGAANDR